MPLGDVLAGSTGVPTLVVINIEGAALLEEAEVELPSAEFDAEARQTVWSESSKVTQATVSDLLPPVEVLECQKTETM